MFSSRQYYFINIAETLNMTKASKQLHVSQPSLSQYLNKLEAELDVKLVERNYSPLRLTDAGKLYYDYLLESKRRDEVFFDKLKTIKEHSISPLKIGIPLQKSHQLTREVLPIFISKHPSDFVSIWEGTSKTVRDKVAAGELEIGFGHSMSDKDSECIIQPLNSEKLLIVCNKDNPIVAGSNSSIDNPVYLQPQVLESQLFFQMSNEYFLYEIESKDLKKHDVNPRQRLIMSNLQSILNVVAESYNSGFAYMPDYVFEEPWAKNLIDKLAFLKIGDENIHWYFSMMRKKDTQFTTEARHFWDCVIESCCKPDLKK